MSTSIPTAEADLPAPQWWSRRAAARAIQVDSYESPDSEALLAAGEARLEPGSRDLRERLTSAVAAVGFLIAAAALAAFFPWPRSLSPVTLIVALAFYATARRVRFPVGGVWAYPTQLALVPMLFLLPTPAVPLIVAAASVLARGPDVLRRRRTADWFVRDIGDCWFAIGPALVLVLAGAQSFAWSRWPIYAGAFAAQVAFDGSATLAICWCAERIGPAVQLPLMVWTYAIDASLSALALLIAAAAVGRPALILLALPLTWVLALFARERREHLHKSLVLSSAYRGTAFLLGDMIQVDDDYTGEHSRGVLVLALEVAEALGLDSTRRRNVEFAALLHDVGKVYVPKEIINKRGPLNDREWGVIRRHTLEGEAMLNKIGGALSEVGRIVRASHERYDGQGYPDGLAGTTIPIEARIVTACDAYSAMTTDRPYRSARTPTAAIAELYACAGTQFDPDVVTALHSAVVRWSGPRAAVQNDPAALGPYVASGVRGIRDPEGVSAPLAD